MTTPGRRILVDHRKRGQKLVPPLNEFPGSDISWLVSILPQLLWIALIEDYHGLAAGVEIMTSVASVARRIHPATGMSAAFATVSSFEAMSDNEASQLRNVLNDRGKLSSVQDPLRDLICWYPACPLRCVFSEPNMPASTGGLGRLKSVILGMYRRRERQAMMVQATVLRLMFDADALRVCDRSFLSGLPEIDRYPSTDLSRKAGASIRATLNAIFGFDQSRPETSAWPRYFWNCGLAIEECEFRDV